MPCWLRATGLLAAVYLFLAVWLPATAADEPKSPPALTAAQQARLKERDPLAADVQKLRQESKLVEAIAAAQKMLAIEREVFGQIHEDVAGSLKQLAEVYETQEDFAAARKSREEAAQ